MEVLTRNKEEKSNYIKEVINGDTLTVTFADGTEYDDYENTSENMEVFNEAMEQQVETGIQNIGNFKSLLGIDIAVSAASATTALAIVFAGGATESVPEEVKIGAIITSGIVALGTAIRANINARKVKEIKKFQKRNEIADTLANLELYPHALVDLRSSVVSLVRSTKNPFAAINSELYTIKDLEQIERNVERDKVYEKATTTRWTN